MKFETGVQPISLNMNNSIPEVPRPYKMAADAILAKSELNNSAIYYRILMKFEKRVHLVPLSVNNSKAEVQRPYKMAEDAIFAKTTELKSQPFIIGF